MMNFVFKMMNLAFKRRLLHRAVPAPVRTSSRATHHNVISRDVSELGRAIGRLAAAVVSAKWSAFDMGVTLWMMGEFDFSIQVSFPLKNPDFLLKNPDFLLKNLGFIK